MSLIRSTIHMEWIVTMPYDARQIANWFITRAKQDGRTLSIMSLLKLTYIAHGWHLEIKGEPLITDKIEAWQYGPVIPTVYNEFRRQGVTVTQVSNDAGSNVLNSNYAEHLEQIWQIYGGLSPFKLSEITHVKAGPWDIATQTGGNYAIIPNDLILQHYKELRLERSKSHDNSKKEGSASH
jgi:uncharacterized phage-associated protein